MTLALLPCYELNVQRRTCVSGVQLLGVVSRSKLSGISAHLAACYLRAS